MMKKKMIWAAGICCLMMLLWLWRVISFNASVEQPAEQIYHKGEIVEYGDNYFYSSAESRKGYKIRVNSAEIIAYDDFFARYGLEKPKQEETYFMPDYIYDVNVTVFNEDNQNIGIDMFETLLCSSYVRLPINHEAWLGMYPNLSVLTFSLWQNTQIDMHFPFAVETIGQQDKVVDLSYLENTLFYLNITQYPVRQRILIN